MNTSLKKIWNDYGVGAFVILAIVLYGIYIFANYLTSKGGRGGRENMHGVGSNAGLYGSGNARSNSSSSSSSGGVQPANPDGQNEVFASVSGGGASPSMGMPTSNSKPNIQNPSELLPKNDSNNQWAQLNPSGKGDLANINLLKAGYHIGIDTVGQTLRNANLQIRSEPANPQLYVGPWQQSTITPDFMRPPLEIGSGSQ